MTEANKSERISIRKSDLVSNEFISLVESHKSLMLKLSPPESSHALLIDGLRSPDIEVWSLFDDDLLVGCGALKIHSTSLGKIKGMHTVESRRGQGLGQIMLNHIISESSKREISLLCLETGSQCGFKAVRSFYEKNYFQYCKPFADYKNDPKSVFMKRDISNLLKATQTVAKDFLSNMKEHDYGI